MQHFVSSRYLLIPAAWCYLLDMSSQGSRSTAKAAELHSLVERLGRVLASEDWAGELNPAQAAALAYLARANRFSRKPSIVAEYLGATRGTVSQTLKALVRKGLVNETADPDDGRSISYEVTPNGHAMLERRTTLRDVLASMSGGEVDALDASLRSVLLRVLDAQSQRTFGACRTCTYHASIDARPFCRLLNIELGPIDADQICAEHTQSNGS